MLWTFYRCFAFIGLLLSLQDSTFLAPTLLSASFLSYNRESCLTFPLQECPFSGLADEVNLDSQNLCEVGLPGSILSI